VSRSADLAGSKPTQAGLQVFVSHTSELAQFPAGKSYIATVKDSVTACRHIPVEMGGFPARDQPSGDLCVEKVRSCDVLVGVLGLRYGSPVRGREDVSYTELEFEAAAEAGIPRLMFLLDPKSESVGIPAGQLADSEYGARQEAFRRRVADDSGLTVQWFRNPDHLGQLVERSLRELDGIPPVREAPYWSTVDESMRILRRRMPVLLSRQRELEQIRYFAVGKQRYRLVTGEAFSGKSALLYEVVEEIRRGHWGDIDVVCYFLSRRASDASADRFLEVMVPQLAYLCGIQAPTPTMDEYRGLWTDAAKRAEVNKRHLVLVVDGLDEDIREPGGRSAASLLPNLAGEWVHVLVSSRPHPDLPDDVLEGHPLWEALPAPLKPFQGAREVASLARAEISRLADSGDMEAKVLGLLAAAAGPLSQSDLTTLVADGRDPPTAADSRRVRQAVEKAIVRSLELVGPVGGQRYEFAHVSLLDHARSHPDLCHPEYRQRIHAWARRWAAVGWPCPDARGGGTPRYLLETYPATLDPERLAALAGDIGWAVAAITVAGIDRVVRNLAAAAPGDAAVKAVLAVVTGQAHNLRPAELEVAAPGYVPRQLWMHETGLTEDSPTTQIRSRLQSPPGATGRENRALFIELGTHDGGVVAMAVLPGGKLATAGRFDGGRILVWDPASPGIAPQELGSYDGWAGAVAVLPDGKIATAGSYGGRTLVWDPASPGTGPRELGKHDGWVDAMAVLPGGKLATAGRFDGGRILVWDAASPGIAPQELGTHDGGVVAMAVLPGGKLATAGRFDGGRILVWDPASPGIAPQLLGTHRNWIDAMTVLPGGRLATAGRDERLLIWHANRTDAPALWLRCPVTAIAAVQNENGQLGLAVARVTGEITVWSLTDFTCKTEQPSKFTGLVLQPHLVIFLALSLVGAVRARCCWRWRHRDRRRACCSPGEGRTGR